MSELTDLELEEKIAYIEGTAVHNCLSGGVSFPPYLEWRLLGPLMIEHEVNVDFVRPSQVNIGCDVFIDFKGSPNRAILEAIIEVHKEQ